MFAIRENSGRQVSACSEEDNASAGSFRPLHARHKVSPELVSQVSALKNCTAVYSVRVIDYRGTKDAVSSLPYRNDKGVWWMPWLQRAMKDVVWLR